ncbi:MAG: sialidase family protein [Rhodoferax sp.]
MAATKIPGSLFLGFPAVLSHPLRLVLWRLLLALACGGALLGLDVWQRPAAVPPARAVWPDATSLADLSTLQVVERGPIPMPEGMAAAHASTLLAMPAGHPAALSVFWFSGDRESGPNVQIAASQYLRATRQWTPARFVVNRFVAGEQLGFGLRRLGNPVAWMDGNGRINLFVVATGGGGWAASRVLHLRQSSTGQALDELAFAPVRVLPLSWLWNTSFLVRNAPMTLADGGMVLPVHFELGIKYPVALRFDREGAFQGMVRMSQRPYLLQPALVQESEHAWMALMRDERPQGKVGVARTLDGGRHWSDLPDLTLDNPDAAVAGLGLAPGQMLLAHNSSIASRGTLDLSRSGDGRSWQRIQTLEQGAPDDEFSYPALLWLDGSLWVTYTVDRHRIAWMRLQSGKPTAGAQP